MRNSSEMIMSGRREGLLVKEGAKRNEKVIVLMCHIVSVELDFRLTRPSRIVTPPTRLIADRNPVIEFRSLIRVLTAKKDDAVREDRYLNKIFLSLSPSLFLLSSCLLLFLN